MFLEARSVITTDVDGASLIVDRVMEGGDSLLRAVDVPQERAVHDREFESFAAVDCEHLHGFGIGLEAAAAILVVPVCRGVVDPSPKPGGQCSRPEVVCLRLRVEELAHVAQIGQEPLTRGAAEYALRDMLGWR